jgi:hypothetical protein
METNKDVRFFSVRFSVAVHAVVIVVILVVEKIAFFQVFEARSKRG